MTSREIQAEAYSRIGAGGEIPPCGISPPTTSLAVASALPPVGHWTRPRIITIVTHKHARGSLAIPEEAR